MVRPIATLSAECRSAEATAQIAKGNERQYDSLQ